MASTHQYYFGRLNISTAHAYGNKKTFVLTGVQSPGNYIQKSHKWSFADIEELSSELGDFIRGYLVKYKEVATEEVINEENNTLGQETIENSVQARSIFFLHIGSGLIAYRPVGKKITSNQFRETFCELFTKTYNNFFVEAEIETIEENYQFFEKLNQFQSITKISFKLHPSNPNLRDEWKKIDEDIKQIGASNYKEEYSVEQNSGKSLNINKITTDKNIVGKVYMAEDGYGEAKVTGTVDGDTKTISTRDNPTSVKILAMNDIEQTFESLKSSFIKIFNRFNERGKSK